MGSRTARPVVSISATNGGARVVERITADGTEGGVRYAGHYRELPIHELRSAVAKSAAKDRLGGVPTNRANRMQLLEALYATLTETGDDLTPELPITRVDAGEGTTGVAGLDVPTVELPAHRVTRVDGKAVKRQAQAATERHEGSDDNPADAGDGAGDGDADGADDVESGYPDDDADSGGEETPADKGSADASDAREAGDDAGDAGDDAGDGDGDGDGESDGESDDKPEFAEPDVEPPAPNPMEDSIVEVINRRFDEAADGNGVARFEHLTQIVDYVDAKSPTIDEAEIRKLVKSATQTQTVTLSGPVFDPVEVEFPDGMIAHPMLDLVVKVLATGGNAYLFGPAGSGKSTIVEQAAETLGRKFYPMSVSPLTSAARVWGFTDANGVYHRTPLRDAFEYGGVFLIDEVDNGNPNVIAELNQALAQGYATFGDGVTVDKHEHFACGATANTNGVGADRVYVGRNVLDAATLNRFSQIPIDYDERLETAVSKAKLTKFCGGTKPPADMRQLLADWTKLVRKVRRYAASRNWTVVVSPRDVFAGAELIPSGVTIEQLTSMRLTASMSEAQRSELVSEGILAEVAA